MKVYSVCPYWQHLTVSLELTCKTNPIQTKKIANCLGFLQILRINIKLVFKMFSWYSIGSVQLVFKMFEAHLHDRLEGNGHYYLENSAHQTV